MIFDVPEDVWVARALCEVVDDLILCHCECTDPACNEPACADLPVAASWPRPSHWHDLDEREKVTTYRFPAPVIVDAVPVAGVGTGDR